MGKLIEQFAKAIRDPDVSHASRLHWAEGVFEGYRDYVSGRADAEGCPYSPGGARATAWEDGVKIAKDDGMMPAKFNETPNVQRADNGSPLCSEVKDLGCSGWCDACLDDHGTCVGAE